MVIKDAEPVLHTTVYETHEGATITTDIDVSREAKIVREGVETPVYTTVFDDNTLDNTRGQKSLDDTTFIEHDFEADRALFSQSIRYDDDDDAEQQYAEIDATQEPSTSHTTVERHTTTTITTRTVTHQEQTDGAPMARNETAFIDGAIRAKEPRRTEVQVTTTTQEPLRVATTTVTTESNRDETEDLPPAVVYEARSSSMASSRASPRSDISESKKNYYSRNHIFTSGGLPPVQVLSLLS